jgi:hypothetical protein
MGKPVGQSKFIWLHHAAPEKPIMGQPCNGYAFAATANAVVTAVTPSFISNGSGCK